MLTLACCIVVGYLSYWCGRFYSRDQATVLAASQKERGDYWFEQYRTAITDEWESESSEGMD